MAPAMVGRCCLVDSCIPTKRRVVEVAGAARRRDLETEGPAVTSPPPRSLAPRDDAGARELEAAKPHPSEPATTPGRGGGPGRGPLMAEVDRRAEC